jgi:hypothetical protein
MKTLSGLSDAVRSYVGRTLQIHFEYGWGWTVHSDGDSEAHEFTEIGRVNMTTAQVIPSEFISHDGATTRGFVGRISQPGHALHDLPVLAFTMSDGFDYDFSSHICPAWRFFIGEGELVLPTDSFPRLRGAKIIGGYGRVFI